MTTVDATDQITQIMILAEGSGLQKGWKKLTQNLNHGTEGRPLRIAYEMKTGSGITNILVVVKDGWIGKNMRDYEILEDANLNLGNKGAPLTFAVTVHDREGTGKGITELHVQVTALDPNGPVGDRWHKLNADLNLGAPDATDPTKPAKPIYLWYRLAP
ncbi:hypothetical protein ACFP3U_20395 [Kitasatospora misakiensis]|uniref:PLAT domain-containing protein n=1 Tax=Kitasatospora misakiensis TaxID=67330 RepID=A0ABW0X8I4_9ACTN